MLHLLAVVSLISNQPASDAASLPAAEQIPAASPPVIVSPAGPTGPITRPKLIETLDKGFGMSLPDDWLTGNVGFVLRPRLTIPLSPAATPAFSMNMIRPQIRMTAWQKKIKVFIQPEFADPVRILDAEASVLPWSFFGVRVGRFITPFSRSFVTPVPKLKYSDFAAANAYFRTDRDVGASIFGSLAEKRFDYEVGVFSGGSLPSNPNDRGLVAVIGRASFAPLGALAYDENHCKDGDCAFRIAFGANGYYRSLDARETQPDGTVASVGVERQGAAGLDFALTWWLFQLQAEVYYRAKIRGAAAQVDQMGGYVHASVALIPSWLELAVRGDMIDPNLRGGQDQLFQFSGQLVTYFLGEHSKLWLDYSYRFLDTNAPRPAGWTNVKQAHQLVLQLQFYL
jgi:hypothetical protein